MYERFTGAGPGWVILTSETDGSFTLLTVKGDQGTGVRRVLCQTVLGRMGVHGVIQACSELREKLVTQAAQTLDCPKDQVVYRAGRFWNREDRRRALSLREVVAKAGGGGPISVTAKIQIAIERSSTSFVAQVAEV